MLKKLPVLLVVLMIFVSIPFTTYSASTPKLVYVNNLLFPQHLTAMSSDGLTYVAATDLAKSLGCTFSFNVDTLSGTISSGGHELVYYLDGNTAVFDGKNIQATVPMKIINNRFMVPAAFTVDKLGGACYTDTFRNALMIFNPGDGKVVYTVLQGDTLWKIAQTFSTTIDSIRQNNALTGDMLYIGQKLLIRQLAPYSPSIPASITSGATVFTGPGFNQPVKGYLAVGASLAVRGKSGDWYKVDSKLGGGYVYRTVVGMTQELALSPKSTFFDKDIPVDTSRDTVTYNNYTVVRGDSVWSISQNCGVQDYEVAAANNITTGTMLYPGQVIKIPVHHIALQTVTSSQYGEVLDWFKQAQYLFPQGKTGKVIDPVSGKSFMVKRTMGASHSDTETLTSADTQVMKQIFGGAWTWTRMPFILEVNGRRFAISIAGMPHAGVDGVPLNQNVDNRSGGYGYGPNDDAISGNGMDGHFDLYFLNCRTHFNNAVDPLHQYTVLSAGGLR